MSGQESPRSGFARSSQVKVRFRQVRSGHVRTSTVQVRTKSGQVRSGKSDRVMLMQDQVRPGLFRPRQTR